MIQGLQFNKWWCCKQDVILQFFPQVKVFGKTVMIYRTEYTLRGEKKKQSAKLMNFLMMMIFLIIFWLIWTQFQHKKNWISTIYWLYNTALLESTEYQKTWYQNHVLVCCLTSINSQLVAMGSQIVKNKVKYVIICWQVTRSGQDEFKCVDNRKGLKTKNQNWKKGQQLQKT